MTLNTRELLVFVAIVTSAIVMQIRQHALEHDSAETLSMPAAAQPTCDRDETAAAHARRVPATCAASSAQRPARLNGRLWV
jgi:hypothetical protein